MKKQTEIKSYIELKSHLNEFVKFNMSYKGKPTLDRVQCFMTLLGNPQNKIKVIHVAGTSGKGSVCTFISQLLTSQGLKVGLTISPHIYSVRERIQINGIPITQNDFLNLYRYISPAIEKIKLTEFKSPSYFEILMAMAYVFFERNKVDVAVVETGLGGLLDASNSSNSQDKFAVITKIGLDHQDVLGKTTSKIAVQKAGIIHRNNRVFLLKNKKNVNNVFIKVCEKKSANYTFCDYKKVLKGIRLKDGHLEVIFFGKKTYIEKLQLSNCPKYQLQNLALSLMVVEEFINLRNLSLNISKLKEALLNFRISARFEIHKIKNKTVLFDGAHNPQKMRAFLASLKERFKKTQFNFLVSFKKGKDYKNMTRSISKLAKKIVFTDFSQIDQCTNISSADPYLVKKEVDLLKISSNCEVVVNPDKAFKKILSSTDSNIVVVTGSLYLVSHLLKNIGINKIDN